MAEQRGWCDRGVAPGCRLSRFYDGCPGQTCAQIKAMSDQNRRTTPGRTYADYLARERRPSLKRDTDNWPGRP